MSLLEERGTSPAELVTERGAVRLWTLSPTVYVTRATGHMEAAHAEVFVRYGEERLVAARGQKLHVFHDWLGMTGYDSVCRQRLTSWSLAHLDTYDEVHLAVRSKIVAMGVGIANIVLKSIIRVHPNLARLEIELRRAMVTPP